MPIEHAECRLQLETPRVAWVIGADALTAGTRLLSGSGDVHRRQVRDVLGDGNANALARPARHLGIRAADEPGQLDDRNHVMGLGAQLLREPPTGGHTGGRRLLSARAVAADRGHGRRLITTSGPDPRRADRGQRVA